jgi:hypothetical protein
LADMVHDSPAFQVRVQRKKAVNERDKKKDAPSMFPRK